MLTVGILVSLRSTYLNTIFDCLGNSSTSTISRQLEKMFRQKVAGQ